jgi:hypothetical protein
MYHDSYNSCSTIASHDNDINSKQLNSLAPKDEDLHKWAKEDAIRW